MKNGLIKIGTTKVGFLPDNSKQLLFINNEYAIGNIYPDCTYIYINEKLRKVKDGQFCKAKITKKGAVIIELIK